MYELLVGDVVDCVAVVSYVVIPGGYVVVICAGVVMRVARVAVVVVADSVVCVYNIAVVDGVASVYVGYVVAGCDVRAVIAVIQVVGYYVDVVVVAVVVVIVVYYYDAIRVGVVGAVICVDVHIFAGVVDVCVSIGNDVVGVVVGYVVAVIVVVVVGFDGVAGAGMCAIVGFGCDVSYDVVVVCVNCVVVCIMLVGWCCGGVGDVARWCWRCICCRLLCLC